jgi:hypothetical protein
MGLHEIIVIGVAVIVFAILIKIGLKVLKWGIIVLILYALWRIFMH